jgi:DNA (cytosine-5)-methyltransferase 1
LHGKLYLELCRVISEIKPRYFVAENVRGILNANGGAAVKLVLAAFLRLGYRASYRLVNMAEHGVPQTRERVIFVGVRLDQWRGSFLFPEKTHRLSKDKRAPAWLPPAVSLRDAIGDLPDPANMHEDTAAKLSGKKIIVAVRNDDFNNPLRGADGPSATIKSTAPPELTVRDHDPNDSPIVESYGLTKRVARSYRASPTIASGASNGDHNHSPLVDGVRRMTVRECARVQSFPDWYEYAGSQADGYRAVGNAVPPLYAKRLAEKIIEYDRRSR